MPRAFEALLLLALGLLTLEAVLQAHPALRPFPERDSGVFLYTGWRILAGEVPYRDVWDHKPPAVFFINALGLLLAGGSPWGMWALQSLGLAAAVGLGYALMRRTFGPLGATLASVAWVSRVPGLMLDGNFTEGYALPLQWLALSLFAAAERHGRYGWRGYAIGLAAAVAFLLRQNLVGVWVAIGLYLVGRAVWQRRPNGAVRPLWLMLLGLASGLLPALAYLAYHGALTAFWDAAFVYNRAYSWAGPRGLYVTTWVGLAMLQGLSLTAAGGWVVGLYSLFRYQESLGEHLPLVAVALLGLPVEALLSAVSGRAYFHYYLAWLPPAAVLTACLLWSLETRQLPVWRRGSSPARRSLLGRRLYAVAAVLAFVPTIVIGQAMAALISNPRWQMYRDLFVAASQHVRETTAPDDTVLIWGAESGVNWAAGRRSPTRFVYQYPLYMPGYQRRELVHEFLADIRAQKPPLIIDTSSTNLAVPPIDAAARQARLEEDYQFVLLPEMGEVFAYITTHYRTERIFDGGWVAYRLMDGL